MLLPALNWCLAVHYNVLEILFVVNSPTKEDAVHKEFADDYDRR